MTSAFVYQIRYDASQEVDHDLLPWDNTANERPWTIRTFLRTQPLDENAFYGFLSPRFKSKTNLSGKEVHEFIRRHGDTADVPRCAGNVRRVSRRVGTPRAIHRVTPIA